MGWMSYHRFSKSWKAARRSASLRVLATAVSERSISLSST